MAWISFFAKQPDVGQTIYYYGPPIGVWRGVYAYEPDDPTMEYPNDYPKASQFDEQEKGSAGG